MYDDCVALVTGGSSGIGFAIASALSQRGARVWILGRRRHELDLAAVELGPLARTIAGDVGDSDLHTEAAHLVRERDGRLDVLVHSAGAITAGETETATTVQFRDQIDTNLLGPFGLTKSVLPLLREARGQIVFLNSTIVKYARAGLGQYAATKMGLSGFADALRAEVNGCGVRVTQMFVGRTASPMQQSVHATEGREYHPELLMQPADVAQMVIAALSMPRTAEVTDIWMRPMTNPVHS